MVFAFFGRRAGGMVRKGLPIQIDLPEHFLEEEVRCGFVVTSRMKRIWAVELDLLAKFDEVCTRHSIKYVALWGTALGAVRHGGFIPWDDDIDVGMDRENYEKFCAVASDEFNEPYFFQNPLTDRAYFSPVPRLRNSLTTAAIKGYDTADYNNGIYIDIDVLDGRADMKFQRKLQNFAKHLFLVPLQVYNRSNAPCDGFVKTIIYCLNPVWHILKYETWMRWYRKVLGMYTSRTTRLCVASSYSDQNWNGWLDKSDLRNITFHKFEFLYIPLPGNVEDFLSRSYGDYNVLPAISDRSGHFGQVFMCPDVGYEQFLKSRG